MFHARYTLNQLHTQSYTYQLQLTTTFDIYTLSSLAA